MKSPLSNIALGLLLTACLLVPARALTTVPRTLDQLVVRASVVFRGTAVAKQATWKGEGANRHIVTRWTFRVNETFKGPAAAQQTLEFFGGELDGVGMAVVDMPSFAAGDEAILFVEGNGTQVCPLVGAEQGAFRVAREADSGVERVLAHSGAGVSDAAAIGLSTLHRPRVAQAMTVAAFRNEILGRVERQKQGLLRVED